MRQDYSFFQANEGDMSEKAYIQTYGCQMNEHDSQRMAEVLGRNGFEMTEIVEEASLVILNTCSVRENPENKVYSQLGRLRRLKRTNPDMVIGVGGCVAQQAGQAILDREKTVDMVFGPDHFFELPELIAAVRRGERIVATEWMKRPANRVLNFVPDQWVEAGHVEGCKAYVAIMKGCDNFCSFCIVPHVRGREVSREPGNILREIRDLVGKGAREVWLLGQNVNSYRAGDLGFHGLLDAASTCDGLKRLRFTSPHPKDWDNALSDLMAARPVVCSHLHLPFQAGSNRVLDLMRRRHTIEAFLEKVAYLKQVVPDVAITTDVIVGFPTETEDDFQRTLGVIEEVRFSQIFSFKYSPRPGTAAAEMADDVPREVKDERLQQVIAMQEGIVEDQLEACIGTIQDVLVDSAHPRDRLAMNGRTEGYRPVKICDGSLEAGDTVQVRITGWRNHWLEGEVAVS